MKPLRARHHPENGEAYDCTIIEFLELGTAVVARWDNQKLAVVYITDLSLYDMKQLEN
jgi:hypothetical protein